MPASADVREIAGFLYSSLQGAILQSKVEQSVKSLERFKNILFQPDTALARRPSTQMRPR